MDWFFELPWFYPAGLAILGAVVWFHGNNRLREREKRLGVAIILVSLLVGLAGYLVDTPRKIVLRNSRAFVDAVVARDAKRMAGLLDEEAIAAMWNKPQIVAGAIHYAQETGLTGARMFALEAAKEGPDLASYFTVWSQHTGTERFPVNDMNSRWKLEWVKVGDQWLIRTIIPLQIGQTSREEIERQYLSRPVK